MTRKRRHNRKKGLAPGAKIVILLLAFGLIGGLSCILSRRHGDKQYRETETEVSLYDL